jgi:hypothetical protein
MPRRLLADMEMVRLFERSRAGGYARAQYRAGLKAWRRRIRPLIALLAAHHRLRDRS